MPSTVANAGRVRGNSIEKKKLVKRGLIIVKQGGVLIASSSKGRRGPSGKTSGYKMKPGGGGGEKGGGGRSGVNWGFGKKTSKLAQKMGIYTRSERYLVQKNRKRGDR